MKNAILSIRTDPETKKAFAAVCAESGLTVSEAVRLFVERTAKKKRLPFAVETKREARN